MTAIDHRGADLRFLLPETPRSAALIDVPAAAVSAWRAAGVAVVGSADERPDVVVAPASRLTEALTRSPRMLMLHGRASRGRLAAAGYSTCRVLALPSPTAPRLLVPLASLTALSAALAPVGRRAVTAASVRGAVGRAVMRCGVAPARAMVTVAARDTPRPWLLDRVSAAVPGVDEPPPWFLWLGSGDTLQRAVLHVLTPDGGWAVKFSRVAGNDTPFRSEVRAALAAARLPPDVARHVPAVLTCGTDGGLPYALETRFAGRPLTEVLLSSWPQARRLAYVERVAGWLHDLATSTATPPGALAGERRRLASYVVPAWAGVSPDLLAAVHEVPGVLVHNDVGTWNVVVDRAGGFGVVDWESSCDPGLPLWDLTYFLADALTLLALRRFADRTDAILDLFRGRSPFSPVLFSHVRRAVDRLRLAPDAVGPLVTLCWLHHGLSRARRGGRLRAAHAGSGPEGLLSALGEHWLRDPVLGSGWRAWR